MPSTDTVRMLTRYKAWTSKVIFDAIAGLPEGEAMKERATLFKTMVNTLNHIYVVDLVWQAHLQGREHGIPALNAVLHPRLADLWRAQQEMDAWYVDWSDTLLPAAAEETLRFTLIGGNKGEMRRGDVIFHIVNHTSYHRGFIADMFYQVPARPPLTDLPVFLRETGDRG